MDFENNKNEQCHSNHDIEELDRIRNQVINNFSSNSSDFYSSSNNKWLSYPSPRWFNCKKHKIYGNRNKSFINFRNYSRCFSNNNTISWNFYYYNFNKIF